MGNKTSCLLVHSFLAFSQASPLLKRIPAALYGAGGFEVKAQGTPIVVLDGGIDFAFQIADSNFVVYDNGVAIWDSQVSQSAGCTTNDCELAFQSDGNLVSYFNGVPTFFTGTGDGQGAWLAFFDIEPYIVIYNAANQPIWHTPITPPPPPPPSPAATPTVKSSTTSRINVSVILPSTPHVTPPSTPHVTPPPTSQVTTSADPITTSPAPGNTPPDPHVIHVPSPNSDDPDPVDDPDDDPDDGGGDDDDEGGGDDDD